MHSVADIFIKSFILIIFYDIGFFVLSILFNVNSVFFLILAFILPVATPIFFNLLLKQSNKKKLFVYLTSLGLLMISETVYLMTAEAFAAPDSDWIIQVFSLFYNISIDVILVIFIIYQCLAYIFVERYFKSRS